MLHNSECQDRLSDKQFMDCMQYAAQNGCDTFLTMLVDTYRGIAYDSLSDYT